MHIVRDPADDGATQLNDLMLAYSSPMRRVCGHLPDALLREMIERMARHKLDELHAARRRRAGARLTRHPRRPAAAPPMFLAS